MRLCLRESAVAIESGDLRLLLFGHRLEFGALQFDLSLEQLGLAAHRNVLPRRHAERTGEESCGSSEHHEAALRRGRCPCDPHHERSVAYKAIGDTEDRGAQRAAATGAVPRLARTHRRARRLCLCAAVEVAPNLRMLRLVFGDLFDLGNVGMFAVDRLLKAFERLHHVTHRASTEDARKDGDLAHTPGGAWVRRYRFAERGELRLPDSGVAAFARSDLRKRIATRRIFL